MQALAQNVTVIPARRKVGSQRTAAQVQKTRVAAYCRVSTDSEEQETSYEAQVQHYTDYIRSKPDWDFVEIYADDGISGTNTRKRDEFNRMIADCEAGKIDLILTKSISRFSRNTLDCLKYTRMLKALNIAVFFEKENINTLDSKGEVLLTIMASLAQQESESLSANVRMGIQYRNQQGKVQINHNWFLGYTKDADGNLVIDPAQAEIVRRIYREYLEGASFLQIKRSLEADGISNGAGHKKWHESNIQQILTNEKYIGDALLQKTYTVSVLDKKRSINNGQRPKYYVEGSHPAIVSAIDFDRVQAEIARRQGLGRSYSGSSVFASKLICGDCGGFYGKKVWHSTDAYRREVWRCNGKFIGEAKCETPTLTTENIQRMFLQAYNQLMGNREQVIQACEVMRSVVADCTELDAQIDALNEEIQVVAELVSQCIKQNASKEQSQEEYTRKYNRLVKRYEMAMDRLNAATAERDSRMKRDRELRIFIGTIEKQPLVLETWDEGLWLTLLETATVHKDNRITFRFKNGTDIEVGVE